MKNIYSPLLWYPIPGYEGYYEINKLGTVRSVNRIVQTKRGAKYFRQNYLKSRISKDGYCEIRLCKQNSQRVFGIHRLLALTFIPKPLHKNEVNHINGIKTDNRIENLEWVTRSENIIHAHKHGLFKTLEKYCKKVKDNCTGKVFGSAKKAAAYYSIPYSTCKNYLNGNRPNPTCLQYDIHI